MMRPRGIFLLEMIVYVAVIMVLMASLIGTAGLLFRGLADNKRQEQFAVERDELDDVLRTDLRAAHAVELLTLKTPKPGYLLRLTQSGGTVVEYAFTRQMYTLSYQGQVPAPQPAPKKRKTEKGAQPRVTVPPPSPSLAPGVGLTVDQQIEGPHELVRTVLVNAVQKSSRHWDFYAFKELQRSTAASAAWELQSVKPGESVDALAGHVFLLATLEYALPGKAPRAFLAGATTRAEPQSKAVEKP